MGNALRSIVFIFSFFFVGPVLAQPPCPEGQCRVYTAVSLAGNDPIPTCWNGFTARTIQKMKDKALQCLQQGVPVQYAGAPWISCNWQILASETDSNIVFNRQRRDSSEPAYQCYGNYNNFQTFRWEPGCGTCEQEPCENPSKNAMAIHVDASSLGLQTDYCLNGCILRVAKDAHNVHLPGSGPDRRTAWGNFVGQSCEVGPTQPQQAAEKKNSDGTDGACTADKTKCVSLQKKNCGYANGEYRCVTANQLTPENPCTQTGSGAVFCRGDALTPPKPDNGNPGQPATPDAKFDVHDPTLIGSPGGSRVGLYYYKPSTVNGSSNSPGGDGNNNGKCEQGEAGSKDCTPLEGGGDCEEGEECGEDSAGGNGCSEEPQCRGEPVECYLVIKQWETMCALAVPENAKIDEAIEAAAGEGGSEPGSLIPDYDPDGGPSGVNVLEKLQEVLNGSGSSAACIADLPLNLNIGGRVANSVVPLSSMCDLFKIVGLFVMLSAGLRSAWIIMRGYGSN